MKDVSISIKPFYFPSNRHSTYIYSSCHHFPELNHKISSFPISRALAPALFLAPVEVLCLASPLSLHLPEMHELGVVSRPAQGVIGLDKAALVHLGAGRGVAAVPHVPEFARSCQLAEIGGVLIDSS